MKTLMTCGIDFVDDDAQAIYLTITNPDGACIDVQVTGEELTMIQNFGAMPHMDSNRALEGLPAALPYVKTRAFAVRATGEALRIADERGGVTPDMDEFTFELEI